MSNPRLSGADPRVVPVRTDWRSAPAGQRDSRLTSSQYTIAVKVLLILGALIVYPLVATPFFVYQIGAQTLVLGVIALSLMFLAGYGGMVSLSQMTVAGLAGYLVAIFGTSAVQEVSLGWPWWLAIICSLILSTIAALVIGMLSIRTEGIRTIMITLAIGVAFSYLTQQNYSVFNGYQGFSGVLPPTIGSVDFSDPMPFYYGCLAVAAIVILAVMYIAKTPFGISLQGTRDNARRMASLGFNVTAHRIAAHALAGFIAAIGGVMFVYYNHQMSPGMVSMGPLINVLIIAVLGGMRHPIGAFIGAAVFVLLQNFAIDLVDRERFNLVIGGVFLAVVFFSPDGILGLWTRLRGFIRPAAQRSTRQGE